MAECSAQQREDELLNEVARHLRGNDIVAALEIAERAYSEQPSATVVGVLAAIAFRQDDIASAIHLLEPLSEELPASSDIPEALGVLNCLAGRISEALYFGKLATVCPPDNRLLPLFGSAFPVYADAFMGIEHKPLLVRGRHAMDAGRYPEAIRCLEQHLQLFRDDVEGLDAYAQCLMAAGEYSQSIGILRSVMTLAGPSATLLSRLGQALVAQGNFDQGMACHRQAVQRAPKATMLWAAQVRDWAYCPWPDSGAERDAVAALGRAIGAGGPKVARQPPAVRAADAPVIGFLCSAPRDDEQRALVAAVASAFGRSGVTVVGFGPGDLDAAVNNVYRGAFSIWRNTSKVDELTLSALIRGEGVSVLVDADGLAAQDRLSLLLRNAAPLQYSWLNVPAGVAVPGAHGNLCFDGAVGPGFLLNAGAAVPSALPASRSDKGEVTFGADVTVAELNAEVVRVWSAILQAVPNSMLVLADRGFQAREVSSRLVEMFGDYGVAHRVDVASGTPEELFSQVDVALAPFPVLRPTAYGAALLAGVPVVTLSGRDRVGFAAALSSLGENGQRMLAADTEAYVALATALVSDLGALAEARKTMPDWFRQSSLFSSEAFSSTWLQVFRERLKGRDGAQ